MHKPTLCTILNILMYSGVALFLYPYLSGHLSSGSLFLILGASIAVTCGFTRAFFTEGDCDLRISTQKIP
jgi:hypothetical protein